MTVGSIPELPYDSYYKFLSAVGIIVVILSFFVEPVLFESPVIFQLGASAALLGLVGWVVEDVLEWRLNYYAAYVDEYSGRKAKAAERKVVLVAWILQSMPFIVLVSLFFSAWVIVLR